MSDWNSTVPAIVSGVVPTGDDWAAILTLLTALTDSWTDYSASLAWTASVSNPAIGNGTITSRYKRMGKLVIFGGEISMGSTTTFGSGFWQLSLPVTASAVAPFLGTALTFDSSVTTARTPGAFALNSTTVGVIYGSNGLVSATAPFTWTTSDLLRWSIVYQAA